MYLREISAWNCSWWLVVDADLEAGGTPVNELHGPLALDGGDGRVDVLGDHVAPVEHAAGHVLAVARVALHHGVGRLKASVGDLSNGECLVIGLKETMLIGAMIKHLARTPAARPTLSAEMMGA